MQHKTWRLRSIETRCIKVRKWELQWWTIMVVTYNFNIVREEDSEGDSRAQTPTHLSIVPLVPKAITSITGSLFSSVAKGISVIRFCV
ncbi:unnamed protein product [Lactuca virosa]|uniref:Uncharacterized protein n=1 Tax=Lactuca virosa TaxID=75947 RepID=A0AAU9NQQ8_9ASTR|nr:unnamed protein product [Lactuca virosa]